MKIFIVQNFAFIFLDNVKVTKSKDILKKYIKKKWLI